ncbi:MAG: hypothetical protein IJ605_02765 [Prevotella sp.]|nr:hypothetical protein [Prevotella sp.]
MNPLSLQRINEQSPYRVVLTDLGDYLFSTTKGVVYSVSFREEFELGGCMSYQFSLTNVNDQHAAYDSQIRPTVVAIIDEFFAQNLDVLLYLCDTSDGREANRNRLFIRWFERSADPSRFTIRTASTTVEGQGFYAAIIVENRNPKLQAITDDFDATAEALTNKPE